jgi:RNA polymerase sigma-70 factor (ECF subfamily)
VARTEFGFSPSQYMNANIDDQALLAGARRLDEGALSEIYTRHSTELFRYAVRLLGDGQLAEDCVAETYSRFLHALQRGRGPHRQLRAYLYRVAHNWIVDQYRRRAPDPVPLDPELPAGSGSEPSAIVKARLEQEQVRLALMRLTADQRQVLVLHYLQGFSNEEVAAALKKTLGAVKSLQHRALAALKRMMEEQEQL